MSLFQFNFAVLNHIRTKISIIISCFLRQYLEYKFRKRKEKYLKYWRNATCLQYWSTFSYVKYIMTIHKGQCKETTKSARHKNNHVTSPWFLDICFIIVGKYLLRTNFRDEILFVNANSMKLINECDKLSHLITLSINK